MLIDCHAHIDSSEFDKDRDQVVKKCNILIVNAGIDYETDIKTLELANKYLNLIPAVGLHPEFIAEKENELPLVLDLLPKAKAISEVGLDYYWVKDENLRKRERELLSKFLEAGERASLPLIIHIRGGLRDLLSILPSFKVKFAIHAFEGSLKDAIKVTDLGGYISVPPIILRDKQRQEIVKSIDLTSLLTETDSPYMGAIKGERNEPCNVKLAVRKIAEVKGIDYKIVEDTIFENFRKFLDLQLKF